MYSQVEAGFTKNARDRSDYNNDYERMTAMAESSVNSFRETMNEFQVKLEKLNYCILSIVNEDEAAQLRLHKNNINQHHRSSSQHTYSEYPTLDDHTRSSIMRVNINPQTTAISGIGVCEVAAALEHELS